MSDHTWEYVQCDGCGTEVRKKSEGLFHQSNVSPEGWMEITDRDHKKLWDMCHTCGIALTRWLLVRRNGTLPEATQQAPEHDDPIGLEYCTEHRCLKSCRVAMLEQSGWLKTDDGWLCVDHQPF